MCSVNCLADCDMTEALKLGGFSEIRKQDLSDFAIGYNIFIPILLTMTCQGHMVIRPVEVTVHFLM